MFSWFKKQEVEELKIGKNQEVDEPEVELPKFVQIISPHTFDVQSLNLRDQKMHGNPPPKTIISNPRFPLSVWKDFVESLINHYGQEVEMFTEEDGNDGTFLQLQHAIDSSVPLKKPSDVIKELE